MKRALLGKLIEWKNQPRRKPILLDGARQVGKTYLVEREFAPAHFNRIHRIDFRRDPKFATAFEESLDPTKVLKALEIKLETTIDAATDLVFFDEIGECQAAVDSLKYFAEDRPDMHLCATGSNIGLLDSFPVGKVEMPQLFPMSFQEFLWASRREHLVRAFESRDQSAAAHEQLWSVLLEYYFVGGMPEAVSAWYSSNPISDRIQRVTEIHRSLIVGYHRDFGKYGGKTNALHIGNVFDNVPLQLQRTYNDSVGRYRFKDVVPGKKQYRELRGPIDWLVASKLASKNQIIETEPKSPLADLAKDNIFKLFFFDVGLLSHALEVSYEESRNQSFFQKGFIAENFVQNELRSAGISPTFSWKEGASEIEFLVKDRLGNIIPTEVKSGTRTKAKSLRSYVDRYSPKKTIKLIGNRGSADVDRIVLPLYYGCFLREYLD